MAKVTIKFSETTRAQRRKLLREACREVDVLAALAGTNILTVGENEGFVKQGGVIGFAAGGDKMRFEINTGAAQRNGVEISSRLLNLASKVGSW